MRRTGDARLVATHQCSTNSPVWRPISATLEMIQRLLGKLRSARLHRLVQWMWASLVSTFIACRWRPETDLVCESWQQRKRRNIILESGIVSPPPYQGITSFVGAGSGTDMDAGTAMAAGAGLGADSGGRTSHTCTQRRVAIARPVASTFLPRVL